MKLRQEVFVADEGKKSAGEQLYEKILGPASPIPATLINIRCGGFDSSAAPKERASEFVTQPGFKDAVPKSERGAQVDKRPMVPGATG